MMKTEGCIYKEESHQFTTQLIYHELLCSACAYSIFNVLCSSGGVLSEKIRCDKKPKLNPDDIMRAT